MEQDMIVRRLGQEVAHHRLWIAFERAAFACDEGAIRHEPVERIADNRELEIARPRLRLEIGPHLLEGDMAMPDAGEVRDWELFLDEQPDLLNVLWAEMLAERAPDRMGPGLRDRHEDELVLPGNDHRPVNVAGLFSRKAATPSR